MPAPNPLSEVPPEEFVQARNALARQLRERGDVEAARRIAALRRPSTVLWLLNQLGRLAPRDVEELIESTRRAQRAQVQGGSGDELRQAMRSQRDAIQRLVGAAEQLAARSGLALTLEQRRRIQDTLQTAASAEPEALRQGTLEHELSAAGFSALLSGPPAVAAKAAAGAAAVAAKATSRKREFEARAEEQRRLLVDRRAQILQRRQVQHAQQASRRLAGRAEQLENLARRASKAAEQAQAKAEEARRAANEAAVRLAALEAKT
jgi:hypothetical protein